MNQFDIIKIYTVFTQQQDTNSIQVPIDYKPGNITCYLFIFLIFFKFYFIFKLYIIVLVLPNIKMNLCRFLCRLSHQTFHAHKNASLGLSWWSSGEEPALQYRGQGFNPWSRKIPNAMQLLGARNTTTEPTVQNQHSAIRETRAVRSLLTTTREQTLLTTPRESLCSNKDPAQPKT